MVALTLCQSPFQHARNSLLKGHKGTAAPFQAFPTGVVLPTRWVGGAAGHQVSAAARQPVLEELKGNGVEWAQGPATFSGDKLAQRLEEAFQDTFWGATAAPRVLESLRRSQAGHDFVKEWPGKGLQHASSYIEGLSSEPFPDPHSGAYPWLEAVEAAADDILAEFLGVTADAEALAAKGNDVWVPAAREEALSYGPDWRTLVLQDRGVWEPVNSRLFPRTTKIFTSLQAPTLEVFFARQQAGTGIKSHTDYVNFVQTSHLGLDVPEGDCWIKVGDHTRRWEQGRILTMETSFMHETANNTPRDRVVLIMRHYHPQVTPLERRALQFVFDCLDNPTPEGIKAAQRRARDTAAAAAAAGGGKRKGKGKGRAASAGGRGFGKPAA